MPKVRRTNAVQLRIDNIDIRDLFFLYTMIIIFVYTFLYLLHFVENNPRKYE